MNEHLIRYLWDGGLYFSSPLSFNDPFDFDLDCLNPREYQTEELASSYYSSLRKAADDAVSWIQRIRIRLRELDRQDRKSLRTGNALELYFSKADIFFAALHAFEDDTIGSPIERVVRSWEVLKTKLANTYGVRCYSVSPSEPLLWAHYADGHRGVALMYDSSERPVRGWKNYEYLPVVYSDSREVDVLKLGFHNAFVRALTTKSTHWSYENEYRLVTLRGPGIQPGRIASLEGIILGERIRDVEPDLIHQFCSAIVTNQERRSGVPNLHIYTAGKVRGEFSVSFERMDDVSELKDWFGVR